MVQLVDIFGNTAQAKVLEFFLKNPDLVIYMSQIAKLLGISHSTVSRVIQPLLDMGILLESKLGTRFRILRLNKNNRLTKLLLSFYAQLSQIK
ncbi:MAG: MarR family transcriptional regulator [Candidatus Heimdallarchaeaceae archaeon]